MEGESMSEWKEVKLGDLVTIKYGKDHKSLPDGVFPVFGSGGLMRKVDSYIYDKPSLLIPRKGTLNNIIYTEEKFWTVDTMFWTKVDELKTSAKFLYYYLKDFNFNALNVGSAVPSLTVPVLNDIDIKLPSTDKQSDIVGILSSLDAKIETNNKLNEKLEEMTQAIFKSWFVDYEPFKDKPFHETELGMIPEGWEVKRISENDFYISDFVSNGSFASLKQNVTLLDYPDYAYFIRNTDLKVGKFKVYVNKESYDFLSKSKLIGGEIIISNVGDVGSVFLCPKLEKPMTLGNNIIMIKPSNEIFKYYLFQYFSSPIGQYMIDGISGGSVQRKFNKTDFRAMKILIPSKNILMNYYNIIKPVFDFKEELGKENDRLASLRDTLLPRLMSGELIV